MAFEIDGRVSIDTSDGDASVADLSAKIDRLQAQINRTSTLNVRIPYAAQRELEDFDRRLRRIGGGTATGRAAGGVARPTVQTPIASGASDPTDPRRVAAAAERARRVQARDARGRFAAGLAEAVPTPAAAERASGFRTRPLTSGMRGPGVDPFWRAYQARRIQESLSESTRRQQFLGMRGRAEDAYERARTSRPGRIVRGQLGGVGEAIRSEMAGFRSSFQVGAPNLSAVSGGLSSAAGALGISPGLLGVAGVSAMVYGAINASRAAIASADEQRRASLSLQTIFQTMPGSSAGAPAGAALFASLQGTAVSAAGALPRESVYRIGERLALGGATDQFAGRVAHAAGNLATLRGGGSADQLVNAIEQVIDQQEITQRQLRLLRTTTGLPVEQIGAQRLGITLQEFQSRAAQGTLPWATLLDTYVRKIEEMDKNVEEMNRGSVPRLTARFQESFDQRVPSRFGARLNAEVAPGLARIFDAATANGGAFDRWAASADKLAGALGRVIAGTLPYVEAVVGGPGNAAIMQGRAWREAVGASAEPVDQDSVERRQAMQAAAGGTFTPQQGVGLGNSQPMAPGQLTPEQQAAWDAANTLTPANAIGMIPGASAIIAGAGAIGHGVVQGAKAVGGFLGIAPARAEAAELETAQFGPQMAASLREKGLENKIADACGTIVEAGIMRAFGQTADEGQLLGQAIQSGAFKNGEWQGPGAMVSELASRGIGATTTTDPKVAAAAMRAGQPVGISTPGHWLLGTGVNDQGVIQVGPTGEAFRARPDLGLGRGTSEMGLSEIETRGGGAATFVIPASAAGARAPGAIGPATDKAARLQQIEQMALGQGLDPGAARAIAANVLAEGGMEGAVGDQGSSFGELQLHRGGGKLEAWAASQGISVDQAAARLRADPRAATAWGISGYLGQAARSAETEGYQGAALATEISHRGQRSATPEHAGAAYAQTPTVQVVVNVHSAVPITDATKREVAQILADPTAAAISDGLSQVRQNMAFVPQ